MGPWNFVLGILALLIIFVVWGIKIFKEYERGVILRLGEYVGTRGPGLSWVWPIIEKYERVNLRIITMDVPPQDVMTIDNVPVEVSAVVYFRVEDPEDSVIQVNNYYLATSEIGQTTLRSVIGQAELDELLSERDRINQKLQQIIDEQTDPWGVKVTAVEVKNVELPQNMQRAMARQAEAERERRAKIIAAEGEHQASEKINQAAHVIGQTETGIQLRYLQTLVDISNEDTTTIAFPIPIDTFSRVVEGGEELEDLDPEDLPDPEDFPDSLDVEEELEQAKEEVQKHVEGEQFPGEDDPDDQDPSSED